MWYFIWTTMVGFAVLYLAIGIWIAVHVQMRIDWSDLWDQMDEPWVDSRKHRGVARAIITTTMVLQGIFIWPIMLWKHWD